MSPWPHSEDGLLLALNSWPTLRRDSHTTLNTSGEDPDQVESASLDRLIDSLEEMVDAARPFRTRWKPMRDTIRQTSSAFKAVRYPTQDEKQAAWDRFQALVQRFRAIQAEEQQSWDQVARRSAELKQEIVTCASEATPPSGLEEAIGTLVMAPFQLVGRMINAVLPGPPVDETRQMLEYCSRKLKDGWRLLSEHKEEMLGRDKKEAFEALRQAQDRLNDAWERWKGARTEAQEAAREAHRARHEAWQDRVRGNVEKLEQRLDRLYDAVSRREAHRDHLLEQRDSAWSEGFRERVEGWIEEEEERIRDIRAKIAQVEDWLREERTKLT